MSADALQIIDFCLWQVFRRHPGGGRLTHMFGGRPHHPPDFAGINGPDAPEGGNPHANALKQHPWTILPSLYGLNAERALSDMFLTCGVFVSVGGSTNTIQVSGAPLSGLKVLSRNAPESNDGGHSIHPPSPAVGKPKERGLSDLRFLRQRILHAKAETNAGGSVRSGLGRAHVLSRYFNVENTDETVHVLKYVFPRQFGLHNVFTSTVDGRDTSQQFADYTLREREIDRNGLERKRRQAARDAASSNKSPPLPRRLRGEALRLVQRIRTRHFRCSYGALLDHYCPRPEMDPSQSSSPLQLASTETQVSAFCRAAVFSVFGAQCFGPAANRKCLSSSIDHFIRIRRFESMSLHDVMEGLCVSAVGWLVPPQVECEAKLSRSDFFKRRELLAELLYYLFDSFLIPLIRSHFRVTESNVHRNRLFYFRHDVWIAMCEPALTSLKAKMLEECSAAETRASSSRRSALGVSRVRFLPKEHGMRPIVNLRRRLTRQQNGRLVLGRSINSILTPAFSVLNHEKSSRPEILGSALFSVGEMFPRVQAFRESLGRQGLRGAPLYFAKIDVKACFDSIPQKRVVRLAETLLSTDEYSISKFARARLLGGHKQETPGFGAKPAWRFITKAAAGGTGADFRHQVATDSKEGRSGTIYVDGVVQRREDRRAILAVLREHIECNMIRIGKRLYRQKQGIPQGSIVSSLLCSLLYADMEREVLGFVDDQRCMLLRLIDDFLLITTDRRLATRFMQTMHAGIPDYGVEVKAEKSQANFEVKIGEVSVPRLPAQTEFPYCGNVINTVSLDMGKDRERQRKGNMADSVTVEHSRLPGQSFYRKTLNTLRLHMHDMLLSSAFNTTETVLSNQYHVFAEVAQKSYHYIRSLPARKQPGDRLVISRSAGSSSDSTIRSWNQG